MELSATEADMTRVIEVKNEYLNAIDLGKPATYFHKLTHLNLSMNKIANITGGFDECPNLRSLIISDNLIKEIPPYMF